MWVITLGEAEVKFFKRISLIVYVNVGLYFIANVVSQLLFLEYELRFFLILSNIFLLSLLVYRFGISQKAIVVESAQKLVGLFLVICLIFFVLSMGVALLFINAAKVVSAEHFAGAIGVSAFIFAIIIGITFLVWVLNPKGLPQDVLEDTRKKAQIFMLMIVVLTFLSHFYPVS